jgi:hypothetical protein
VADQFSMARKFSSSTPTSALATCSCAVGIEVDATDSLQAAARSLWQPKMLQFAGHQVIFAGLE